LKCLAKLNPPLCGAGFGMTLNHCTCFDASHLLKKSFNDLAQCRVVLIEGRGRPAMASEVAEITLMTDSFRFGEATRSVDAALAPLIERAQSGNTAAFEQLVIHYQRKVLATAWRMLGNQDDARDAAQEVFLRAFKYLGGFKADQDFAGWLYRITVNVCRDAGRKRNQAAFTSFEDERDSGSLDRAASDENLEAAAIRSEQRAMVADALNTLTKKERAALVLRDLEGLPTDEVARLLGTTEATVRSQVSAARAKIKQFHERLLRRRRR
jgi:RNA polymerase sigma-70 factor (ECF subfamily)